VSPASALLPVVPALNGFSAVQSMKEWQPDIFTFLDYREYLQAYYEAAKENTRAFSYRYFARKAGLSSASFLRHVMRGERNIRGSTQQFSKALSHTKEESEFFEMLVKFSQATSDAEKNKVFERVCAFRRFREARRIDKAMFHYLSHWYYPAIREMTARSDFREDPTWIGSQLIPPVPAKKVAGALDVLLELELIIRNANGNLERGAPTVTTGHEVRSLAIANYHREMLERAGESIELVNRDLRDLAAMTVCISPETIPVIKKRVHQFRELLLEICDRDTDPSVVYQINTQLFPLSVVDEPTEPT
jgi:uncharacterized protein (TIGR02147 family)